MNVFSVGIVILAVLIAFELGRREGSNRYHREYFKTLLALARPSPPPTQLIWRHKASGVRYVELHRAQVQASTGPLEEGDWVVIYRELSQDSGKPVLHCYARDTYEFGEKFERV